MVARPETSGTTAPTDWPSTTKLTVPVGSGLPGREAAGETLAVKVYAVPGDALVVKGLSVVVLATWVDPVTVTVTGGEVEEA